MMPLPPPIGVEVGEGSGLDVAVVVGEGREVGVRVAVRVGMEVTVGSGATVVAGLGVRTGWLISARTVDEGTAAEEHAVRVRMIRVRRETSTRILFALLRHTAVGLGSGIKIKYLPVKYETMLQVNRFIINLR
jgi:hypothetical protein